MAKLRYVGVECANSFTKSFTDDREPLVYPNTTTEIKDTYYTDNQFSTKENVSATPFNVTREESNEDTFDLNTIYTYKGVNYRIGHTKSSESSSSNDVERYFQPTYERELITALANSCDDDDAIIFTTGIPSAHYNYREDIEKSLNEKFVGEHTIKINGKSKTFTILKAHCILQPLGTFYYTFLQLDGTPYLQMVERYTGNRVLVADLGWGTSDIASIFDFALDSVLPSRLHRAAKDYNRALLNEINISFKDSGLGNAEIDLLDLDTQLRENNNHIVYGNETYDVSEIVEKVKPAFVAELAKELKKDYTPDDYDTFIFTGGSTALFEKELVENFKNRFKNRLNNNIVFVEDSQIANARGYFLHAKYLSDNSAVLA